MISYILAAVAVYPLIGALLFVLKLEFDRGDPHFARDFEVLQGALAGLVVFFWPLFLWDWIVNRRRRG